MYSGRMSADKDDDLKSFQIGLMSGASTAKKKGAEQEHFEISKNDFPNLSASIRSKATFKKKAAENLDSLKRAAADESESAEEREAAAKAKKAWERAMEVIAQSSLKE